LETIATRFEHEGMEFLTITLPEFGKSFEQALEEQQVTHNHFPSFGRSKKSVYLPVFLGGLLERVFNAFSGGLLVDPDIDAIIAIRQITLLFSKLEGECSDARNLKAIEGYYQCEKEVAEFAYKENGLFTKSAFLSMRSRLFGDVLSPLNDDVADRIAVNAEWRPRLIPKHGPGKTADRLFANAKYDLREWTTRLERVFPFMDYVLPNARHHEVLDTVNFLEPGEERPVRVTLVPKTPKSPRIIAITNLHAVHAAGCREKSSSVP